MAGKNGISEKCRVWPCEHPMLYICYVVTRTILLSGSEISSAAAFFWAELQQNLKQRLMALSDVKLKTFINRELPGKAVTAAKLVQKKLFVLEQIEISRLFNGWGEFSYAMFDLQPNLVSCWRPVMGCLTAIPHVKLEKWKVIFDKVFQYRYIHFFL